MAKGLNEVGAVWNKRNNKGEYLSISIDLDALLELTGGATGKVNLNGYLIEFEKTNPNAPDYRVKYYPRTGASAPVAAPRPAAPPPRAVRRQQPLPDDDDIPF